MLRGRISHCRRGLKDLDPSGRCGRRFNTPRQFSYARQPTVKALCSGASRLTSSRSIPFVVPATAILSSTVNGVRFKSTEAASAAAAAEGASSTPAIQTLATEINPTTTSAAGQTLDPFSRDFTSSTTAAGAAEATPDQIGFLNSLGIDFGWGPTSTMQWLLEHVHVYTDTPWWISIITSAVILRVCLLPFNLKASDMTARMKAVNPYTMPYMRRAQKALEAGDMAGQMRERAEVKKIYEQTGVKPWMAFLAIVQAPFAYGTFRLLRAMSDVEETGLSSGGTAWFYDLASSDPYFVLPALSALSLHATSRFGNPQSMAQMSSGIRNVLVYGLPAVSFAFTSFFPAALSLHFATTSFLGFGQAVLFRNEAIRARLGMFPLNSTPQSAEPPQSEIRKNLTLSTGAEGAVKKAEQAAAAAAKKEEGPVAASISNFSTSQIMSGGQSFSVGQAWKDMQEKQKDKKKEKLVEEYEQKMIKKIKNMKPK